MSQGFLIVFEPNYPHIVLSFPYKGWRLQVDEQEEEGQLLYSVWAHHQWGCDVAVPLAFSRIEAIRKAKQWIDHRSLLSWPPQN